MIDVRALTTEYQSGIGFCGNTANSYCAKKSSDSKTIYWYVSYNGGATTGAAHQANTKSATYRYVALA